MSTSVIGVWCCDIWIVLSQKMRRGECYLSANQATDNLQISLCESQKELLLFGDLLSCFLSNWLICCIISQSNWGSSFTVQGQHRPNPSSALWSRGFMKSEWQFTSNNKRLPLWKCNKGLWRSFKSVQRSMQVVLFGLTVIWRLFLWCNKHMFLCSCLISNFMVESWNV